MADKLVPSRDDGGALRRFVDMADGTFAELVVSSTVVPTTGGAGYPTGAIPQQASSGTVANAPAAASLPALTARTTYVSGLQVVGVGATAAGVTGLAIAGLKGGTLTFPLAWAAGALPLDFKVQFNPPLPASAVNTAIAVTLGALGAGNTALGLSVQGFQAA